ncbi:OmpA family protein [Entomobacter blattae]|uniref:OmpA-like domain-containing protein n=1 Tax=Entomobacter blattae TaxID=2762277 RepID=A0A7H1NTC2_9PROT|nr:hypothetical protein [Entomobacter blattae]QNT79032.1 hypothetical protein JGUZn3_18180 [Entomobacter blattae]
MPVLFLPSLHLSPLGRQKDKKQCFSLLSGAGYVCGWLALGIIGPFFYSTAHAQVSVNQGALDSLGPAPAKPVGSTHTPSSSGKNSSRKASSSKIRRKSSSSSKTVVPAINTTVPPASARNTKNTSPPDGHPAATVIPAVPTAAPPLPVFTAPVINVPLHPEPLPAMPKPDKEAKGSITHTPNTTPGTKGGFTIVFQPKATTLAPFMIHAIQNYAKDSLQHEGARIVVTAFSSGVPTDLSTPRRTAFARGLAVRAVLANAGIATTHIYVRAVGLPAIESQTQAADRVEITRTTPMANEQKENAPTSLTRNATLPIPQSTPQHKTTP